MNEGMTFGKVMASIDRHVALRSISENLQCISQNWSQCNRHNVARTSNLDLDLDATRVAGEALGKVDVVTSENHLANVIETLRENHDEAQTIGVTQCAQGQSPEKVKI